MCIRTLFFLHSVQGLLFAHLVISLCYPFPSAEGTRTMDDSIVEVKVIPNQPEVVLNEQSTSTDVEDKRNPCNISLNSGQVKESYQCWVCLATNDEDDENSEWIHPCRCRGTAKWVHETCLQTWIDEKQRNNSSLNVSCQQCNTKYLILFPSSGRIFFTIELCDRLLYSASPLAAITCIFGSIYWTSVCYGAFTIMQIMGKEDGKTMIEQSDPVFLLLALPSIPCVLFCSKLIRWEDQLLKLWFKNSFRFPLIGHILGKPADKTREFTEHILFSRESLSDPLNVCRNFCGALLLPTAATFIGGLFFSNVKSNVTRALLGGITFIVAKGLIKILLRQHQYIRQTHRKISNFPVTEE